MRPRPKSSNQANSRPRIPSILKYNVKKRSTKTQHGGTAVPYRAAERAYTPPVRFCQILCWAPFVGRCVRPRPPPHPSCAGTGLIVDKPLYGKHFALPGGDGFMGLSGAASSKALLRSLARRECKVR